MTIMTNKPISVVELKENLSEVLARVAFGGEEFIVARRGRPVARLVPIAPGAGRGLGAVKGWLENDDPFLTTIDEIVSDRAGHLPRRRRSRS